MDPAHETLHLDVGSDQLGLQPPAGYPADLDPMAVCGTES